MLKGGELPRYSFSDLRIKLKIGGVLVFELNAGYIQDIKHQVEKGLESLEVVLAPNDSLWIRLKPEISIYHTMTGRRIPDAK